jgi:hypothetical protein
VEKSIGYDTVGAGAAGLLVGVGNLMGYDTVGRGTLPPGAARPEL